MLTKAQIAQFRKAVACHNACGSTDEEAIQFAEVISSDDQVAETRDTIEDFFTHNGRRLNRRGERFDPPWELNKNDFGDVYVWENIQKGKGNRRGTLYVMQFGEFCAAHFTGEIND